MSNRKLYSFNWSGEGFNQVWADNKAEARRLMNKMGRDSQCNNGAGLVPVQASLRLVTDVSGYFNNFPLMD
jgi:hypothetical protein